MEYLPERRRDLGIQQERKAQKWKHFRRYLADSNVVLALVKYLLALRDCKPWPENPTEYLKDFFGQYRDPKWDDMEALEASNKDMEEAQIPGLEQKIAELEEKLAQQKKRNFLAGCFAQLETDGILGYKLLVMRLSGQPKFDLDTKINKEQFIAFVLSLLSPPPEAAEEGASQPQYFSEEQIFQTFSRAAKTETPFAGDVENPLFKYIVAHLREYKPEEPPAA